MRMLIIRINLKACRTWINDHISAAEVDMKILRNRLNDSIVTIVYLILFPLFLVAAI